jgi:hypothetical protein
MERAATCDRNDLQALAEAIRGLQSTDDPALVDLHDDLLRRYNEMLGQQKSPTHPPMSETNKISLWMEGFEATGDHSGAQLLGIYEAASIADAVEQHMLAQPQDREWIRKEPAGFYTFWACRIFDNEHDARVRGCQR